jgi:simple sugar transport system permease protein
MPRPTTQTTVLSRLWLTYRLQISVLSIFLLLWASFLIINPFAFTNAFTYTSLLSTIPPTTLVALTQTLIVIMGEIDLSFPSIMSLSSYILAASWQSFGPSSFGILLALLSAALAGLANGIVITKGRVSSFIATLGSLFLLQGLVNVLSQGFGIALGQYKGSPYFQLFVGRIGPLPIQALLALLTAALLWLLLNSTEFFSHVYFVGDNRQAARLMGINVDRVIIAAYALHGLVSGLAGILATLEIATFFPTIGEGYLLSGIAAVVIGGTPLTGGTGSLFGTFIGSLTLGWIVTGILAGGVSGFWTSVFYGLVIIASLLVQALLKERELRRIKGLQLEAERIATEQGPQ